MKSLTKALLSEAQIRKVVKNQFDVGLESWKELNDGFYNSSYLIVLETGQEAVLKVAPPKGVDILTYEIDIMASEVQFYQLAAAETDMPVPQVYGYDSSGELIPNPYYFMSKLKGVPLNKIEPITPEIRRSVYEVLAANLGKLHRIKGENFGYITMEEACRGKGIHHSIMVALEALYRDVVRKEAGFPFKYDEIVALYEACAPAFEVIKEPCLVHFDLWDGNIFVLDEKPIVVEGFIDFERGFYGCPAADLGQASGYLDFDEHPWFMDIYNQHSDQKIVLDDPMRVRMAAYRFYVFLIMHVECWYRDIDGSFEGQKNWVAKEIQGVKEHFELMIQKMSQEL